MMMRSLILVVLAWFLSGCASAPPKNASNLCAIFEEKDDWYDAAQDMWEKWGVPIHVPMAMMYQESSFKSDALPPRDYVFFGMIPWGRVSSAYGFSQAKTMTWEDYVRETDNSGADRDDFDDAIDFMGWFISKTHKLNKISKWDAYNQYLNYHEGWGGYRKKSFNKKPWLKNVAQKVQNRAYTYSKQLKGCQEDLEKGWLWKLIFG